MFALSLVRVIPSVMCGGMERFGPEESEEEVGIIVVALMVLLLLKQQGKEL